MANVVVYRTYPFKSTEQDPIIEEVQKALATEGLDKKSGVVKELSGVSASTLYNWFNGKTKCPRYSTIAAVYGAIGYHPTFMKQGKFDLAAARAEAKRWNLRKEAAKLAAAVKKAPAKRSRRQSEDRPAA